MIFSDPQPFEEALAFVARKQPLPMTLDSRQYRALPGALKRRAAFSSKVTSADFLQRMLDPIRRLNEGQTNLATARVDLKALRDALTVDGLEQDGRLNLILRTNEALAFGYGTKIRDLDPLGLQDYPAWKLVRFETRKEPRDWPGRWQTAAQASGDGRALRALLDSGEMIARKDSPIWSALGDSGLFADALDTDYPPFAFSSGMDRVEVSRDEAVAAGAMEPDEQVQPQEVEDFNETAEVSAEQFDRELQEALAELEDLEVADGVLQVKNSSTDSTDSTDYHGLIRNRLRQLHGLLTTDHFRHA